MIDNIPRSSPLIQLISQKNYVQMPWKNKKGMTSQILIEPSTGSLEKMDFEYRLSSAPIKENTVFSKFPGFSRILIPTQGVGFSLNGTIYEVNEPAHFSGSDETECELLEGEVIDLGLVFNPKIYKAHVKILKFKKGLTLNKDPETTYLINILRGDLSLNNISATTRDTFLLSGEECLNFSSTKEVSLALFMLQKLID